MLRICTKMWLLVLLTFMVTACEPEQLETSSVIDQSVPVTLLNNQRQISSASLTPGNSTDEIPFENLQDMLLKAAIPSECGATRFTEVSGKYFEKLFKDPRALDHLEHYKFLNREAAKLKIEIDYFGTDGSYTSLVHKLERDLHRFWDLPHNIEVLGQHNTTLEDRENLAEIYWRSIQDMESKESAYALADEILELNDQYPELINSPFISSDGFAAQNRRIVIGDGLVELFAETGLSHEIVWTGILTHEWAHQVQFAHRDSWYSDFNKRSTVETRTLELEADFFSGYYMTHKRGATYNWKRAEEFFELFYQAGDCSFEFEQHHGTPFQRKQASYEGYLLAESSKKKGHILTADQLHEYFHQHVLPKIVQESEYL